MNVEETIFPCHLAICSGNTVGSTVSYIYTKQNEHWLLQPFGLNFGEFNRLGHNAKCFSCNPQISPCGRCKCSKSRGKRKTFLGLFHSWFLRKQKTVTIRDANSKNMAINLEFERKSVLLPSNQVGIYIRLALPIRHHHYPSLEMKEMFRDAHYRIRNREGLSCTEIG